MNCKLSTIIIAFALLGTTHCSQEKARLQALNWDPFNRVQMEQLIDRYGKHSPDYNPAKPPYAVFDWDNTSIFLDIEEAVLAYQIQQLAFAATPEQFSEAIRKDIPSTHFADISADIINSYTWLYNHYEGFRGRQSLDEVKRDAHYADFAAKLPRLYKAIGDALDHAVAYPWITYLFVGMTEQDVQELTRQTIQWQLTQEHGLRLVPEMQDLYHTLRQNGFDVWVCSASFIDVIKEISSNPAYGYDNPADHALAMELERDADGKIQARFRAGYDQTQGEGKTATIRRFLVSKYGYGPVFIAGDSEGDQNMMQDFEDTQLVLIINRFRSPQTLIGQFSRQAVDTYGNTDAKYLLQGRDENTGFFVPLQQSTKLTIDNGQWTIICD
ncbi:phosphoserine phosphatase [Bacteroidia bacterium]|nr:phosphoserine phosphatase [Bacteroidia bacterium]